MKPIFHLLACSMLHLACHHQPAGATGESSDTTSKTNIKAINNADPSTDSALQNANVKSDDYLADEVSEIMYQYLQLYQSPIIIDTLFFHQRDTFRVTLKHQCLMDSAITVPKRYLEAYKLDSFQTHNFAGSIKVVKNDQTILETTVTKKDFDKFLESPLKEYAVLLYPNLEWRGDSIIISYSLSIPLTDLGDSVESVVKSDGTISFIQ